MVWLEQRREFWTCVRKGYMSGLRRVWAGELSRVMHEVSLAWGTGQMGEPYRTRGEDPKKGGNTWIWACGSVSMANCFLFFDHIMWHVGFFSFFLPSDPPSHGILIPWPGIEPTPPAVETWSPNCWTTREAPLYLIFSIYFHSLLLQKHPNTRESRKYH